MHTWLREHKWAWAVVILVLVLFVAAMWRREPMQETREEQPPEPQISFGIAGYSPAGFPNSSIEQAEAYWADVNEYSSQLGVHVDWQDLNFLEVAVQKYKGDIVLVLGLQRPTEWLQSEQQVLAKIFELLGKYPQIKYLGIGNEVNLLAEQYEAEFPQFLEAYRLLYWETKRNFPEVKIFTTFQYEALKGEGYLMGNADVREPRWELLDEIAGYYDMVGLTVYPYFDLAAPAQIPTNYFEPLLTKVTKPIIITETAWISQPNFSGELEVLLDKGLTGSEEEQVEYLGYLQTLSVDKFPVVNWLFLHDPKNWSSPIASLKPSDFTFASAALKNYDGGEKQIWEKWKNLFARR